MASFDQTLRRLMDGKIGSRKLSALTGIPKTTIDNWLRGIVVRPRDWRPILRIAQALLLTPNEVETLLLAAQLPTLDELAAQVGPDHPDRSYLRGWLAPSSLPMARRHQLRLPVADFAGRAAETAQMVAALRTALAQERGAIISGVLGMGGIGKTELAHVVAHQMRTTFPDAQIVVDLHGSSATPSTIEQALKEVIHAFMPDVKLPEHLEALEQQYRTILHGQRALILADDARDSAQVRPLIPPLGCALLITSRRRFTLPGMMSVHLEQLEEQEAVALLRRICDRVQEIEARELARACGYLPLALRVSGSILHNDSALSVASYLGLLAGERQRLSHLRDPDDAQLDVAATLTSSYAQLNVAAQQAFQQLGVFVADFATDLAVAVVNPPADENVETILRMLLRRSLLLYDSTRERWRMHDLVRDLARHYLEAAGELDATQWRYARAATQLAGQIQEQYLMGGDAIPAALERFDTERPHIDTARRWAALHAGRPHGDQLLLDDAAATKDIGMLRHDARRERIPRWEQVLAAARRLGNRRAEGQTLRNLGVAHANLGDIQAAIPCYEQAVAIAREIASRRDEGMALNNLAATFAELGKFRRAIPRYEQAVAIAQEIAHQRMEGFALGNLGNAYVGLGEVHQAIPHYERAITIARVLGDRYSECQVLGNLGLAQLKLGKTQRAIQYFEQQLAMARMLGDRRAEGIALQNLGRADLNLNETFRATESLERSLTIAREIGEQRVEGYTLSHLACAQAWQGNSIQATATFAQAAALLNDIGDRWGVAEGQWQVGLALARQGNRDHAIPMLRDAVTYQRKIEHAQAAEHAELLARLEAGGPFPADRSDHRASTTMRSSSCAASRRR